MKHIRCSIVYLALTWLGPCLVGSVVGCSSANSETPQHDPVEGRKVKDDLLKKVSRPGTAKPGKAAATAEDRF